MGDLTQDAQAMVAGLATATNYDDTIECLEKSGLNLYDAWPPHQLGEAMATGLITWDTMARWTEKPAQQDTQQSPAAGATGTLRGASLTET